MPRKTSEQPSATPRMVAVENIVGLAEIAERTKSTPHAVWNWTKRYDGDHPFPKPIATASGRPVYDWAEVAEWNKNWVRSKGGYHTHKSQRDGAKKTAAPRRQFMEGDDDGTKPKSRAKKSDGTSKQSREQAAKRTARRRPAASKPAEKVATVTPIRRARRSRAAKA